MILKKQNFMLRSRLWNINIYIIVYALFQAMTQMAARIDGSDRGGGATKCKKIYLIHGKMQPFSCPVRAPARLPLLYTALDQLYYKSLYMQVLL